MLKRETLLVLIPLQAPFVAALSELYELIYEPTGHSEALWQRLQGQPLRAVLTNGTTGFSEAQMALLPQLGQICSWGAGYENIDMAAARSRGIGVSHAPGINNATVADHALALMLGLSRGLVALDAAVKRGDWQSSRAERPTINGRRLGLLGMGNIGQQIARRAAGFDMQIAYCTRTAKPGLPWRYIESLLTLATESDYLVLACPGGAATRHLVNREVLQALGPEGFLVNIARGSVVDTEALIAALQADEIAGAALDVIDGEPVVPPALAASGKVLLTPHVSGRSPEAQRAQLACAMGNLAAFFAGRELLTPVP